MTRANPLYALAGSVRETVRGLLDQWKTHPILLLASGIAFHAILCLIPLFLLGTALLGMVLNSSDQAVRQIHETITAAFPQNPYAGKIQETLLDVLSDIIRYRKSFGWFGMLILLWTSTSLLDAVRTALNTIFHLRGTESFLRGMVKSFVLTVVLTLLFLLANLSTWFFIFAGSLLERWSVLRHSEVKSALPIAVLIFANIPAFFMYFIFYRFVPVRGIPTRAAFSGAATASVIWWISGLAFGWYLTSFGAYGSLYGTYTFLMVFLLWIYYSSTAFMVGAMVCQEHRKRRERP